MPVRRIRDVPPADDLLDEPVRVRRRWPRYLRARWILLYLSVLFLAFCFLRVGTLAFPVVPGRAVVTEDGWTVLRGAFHLQGETAEVGKTAEVLRDAFDAGLDFVVLVDEKLFRARSMARAAPLTVVAGQRMLIPQGFVLVLGASRPVQDGEAQGNQLFSLVRELGGWSVVARVADPDIPWTGFDAKEHEGIEFLNAVTQRSNVDWLEWLGRWVALALGSPYARLYLGLRPIEGLAHWDDCNRKGQVVGFCGVDTGAGSPEIVGGLVTYVLVREGFGPYGPGEVSEALRAGRHHCGLPDLGDPRGFRFFVRRSGSDTVLATMGSRIGLQGGLEVVADLHLPSDPGTVALHLYLDGQEIHRKQGTRLVLPVDKPGAYRIEASALAPALPLGRKERRFLFSNPIHILSQVAPSAPRR